jgi:hypothetical protein
VSASAETSRNESEMSELLSAGASGSGRDEDVGGLWPSSGPEVSDEALALGWEGAIQVGATRNATVSTSSSATRSDHTRADIKTA